MLRADDYTSFGGKTLKNGGVYTKSVCSICGKKFLSSDDWVYRANNRLCCSYSCMRIPQKKREEERRRKQEEYLAKLDARKKKEKEQRDQELLQKLEAAQLRVKVCLEKISMYAYRAKTANNPRDKKNISKQATTWRRKYRAANLAVEAIKKEVEAKQKCTDIPREN